MCIPQSLAALQVINSAVSGVQNSRSQSSAARAQSDIAKRQEEQTRKKAEEVRRQAERNAQIQRVETEQLKSRQRNSLAGIGVDAASGTALDLLSDSTEAGRIAEENIRRDAKLQQESLDDRANNFASTAAYQNYRANQSERDGLFETFNSTLLTGARSTGRRGLLRF